MDEIQNLADLKTLDVEAVARAIEEDAGEPLPNLRKSLQQAKEGQFARIHKPGELLARSAREKTGMTQQAFARCINTPVATLRDWEQGRFDPPGCALSLFKLLNRRPEIIAVMIDPESQPRHGKAGRKPVAFMPQPV
ncbi:hypothetical protein FACS189475_07610 [Betaproteobacteria bacterium]|nr:hypothetical protein FACS189475_07610 [Betaproteobacteria bacterium]